MFKNIKNNLRRIEWVNFLFITLTPIVALIGTSAVIYQKGFVWQTWVLFFVMMMATGLGITAGYHRLFSHRAYQAHPFIKLLFSLFGGAAFEGSVNEWCSAHRKHHRHVDTDLDPYNIKRGFWYAHVGWVIVKADQSDVSNIKDLKSDSILKFQERFYIPLAVLIGFALPLALGALWGDMWGGFFIAGFLRVVLNHHFTFFINSWAHTFGSQNFSNVNSAKDSWAMAFLTYGEGFHNFHHGFEADYRNGIAAWHYDPGKWLIWLLAKMKLAFNLKRAAPERILAAQIKMQELKWKDKARATKLGHEWELFVARGRIQIEQICIKLETLKSEYHQLKRDKNEQMQQRLTHMRAEIKKLHEELNTSLQGWKRLLRFSQYGPSALN